jgi:uncharacterized membrane protein YeaQ/YmgE (transglycosylase-associated protein family)
VPIPWTSALLPEAAVAGLVTAVAAGAVGGFIGGALTGVDRLPARLRAVDKRAALLGAVVLVGVVAWNIPLSQTGPRSATVALRDLEPGPERTVAATIRIDPPGAVADDPEFLNVTAWQGGGSLRDPLERTGPGSTARPSRSPHGGWKATLRLQQGSSLVAVPIFQPEDWAIPAPETPAAASFTRDFRPDIEVLQRERKHDVAGVLSAAAYLSVLAIAVALFVLLAWVLLRVDAGGALRARPKGRTAPSRAELV